MSRRAARVRVGPDQAAFVPLFSPEEMDQLRVLYARRQAQFAARRAAAASGFSVEDGPLEGQ